MLNGNKFINDMQNERVKGTPDNKINKLTRTIICNEVLTKKIYNTDRPGYLEYPSCRDMLESSIPRDAYVAYDRCMYKKT